MGNKINKQDLSFNSRRLSRVLTGIYDKQLRPSGIRSTQFNVLCFLSDFDICNEPLSDIGASLSMDRSTISRNLVKLITAGYVSTVKKRSGRNTPGYFLTDKGKDALGLAMPLWRHIQGKIAREIGEVDFLENLQGFESLIGVVGRV